MTHYVTFGQRYRREAHPFDERVHPDGYFAVDAPSLADARRLADVYLGRHYANLYDAQPDAALYPLGLLATIR